MVLRPLTLLCLITLLFTACGESTVFDRPPSDAGVAPAPDTPSGPDVSLPEPECVSDEACEGKEVCCDGVCAPEISCREPQACSEHGAPCRTGDGTAFERQGDFWCVALDAEGTQCVTACETNFAVAGCPAGTFCLDVNAGEQELRLCLPGECDDADDCGARGTGSCVQFGNGAGFCFVAGGAQQGDSCGGDVRCASDLFCVTSTLGGTCQPLCDMWEGDGSECPSGTTCGYLTLGTGVCRPQTRTGRDIAESCDPEGGWCSAGVQCFDFRTGGEPLPVCTAWCRPDRDDCRGRFQNHDGFCRTVFVSGGEPIEDFGLCL